MINMGGNIEEVLSNEIASLEGKCLEEGYLKRGSTKLIRYSCGVLKGANIVIQVIFQGKIANPVKGQTFICVVENNTRAGIKGRLDEAENPFIVFLAKDKTEKPDKPKEEKTVFVFKSNSADKAPGKGVNEQLAKGHTFTELSKIKDWRRMLSNFDVTEFDWSGEGVLPEPFPAKTRWNSIEHAFQGAKHWWKGHKKDALRFTLSGDIGKGDGAEAQKNRKLIKIDDMAGWDELSWKVMASAAEAKYTQNPERMRMLKATAPAELFHLTTQRGKKSDIVPFKHLEYIRTL